MGKLNLEVLKKEQQWGKFCEGKVRDMKKKPDLNFLLDHNSFLRKVIKLKYTIESAIVVPRKLTSIIIIEFHNAKGHQSISRTVNMIRSYFWWIGMRRDMHQHISTCKLCIQFLPIKMYTQSLHLEIPWVPFTGCTSDCIRPLPTTSKGHRHALTVICLLTSYLIAVPSKTKTADEVSMAYMKEILPKTFYPKFILQDNGTELKNEQVMSVSDSLGIKHIYSNPYYPKGNSRLENIP